MPPERQSLSAVRTRDASAQRSQDGHKDCSMRDAVICDTEESGRYKTRKERWTKDRGDREEEVNLRRVFQNEINFFDALQTEQTNLPHGARRIIRGEVQNLGSVTGLRSTEGSDHAQEEVMVRSCRE